MATLFQPIRLEEINQHLPNNHDLSPEGTLEWVNKIKDLGHTGLKYTLPALGAGLIATRFGLHIGDVNETVWGAAKASGALWFCGKAALTDGQLPVS